MKAILVVDIPLSIDCEDLERYEAELKIIDKYEDEYVLYKHHLSLKPMPQKKEVEVNKIEDIMHTEYSIEDIYKNKYIADIRLATDKLISLGWNSCIDEILGNDNETNI